MISGWKQMMIAAVALAGCAGVHPTSGRDSVAGRWTGEVDRDGWSQPLAFEIEKDGDSYRGEWRSDAGGPVEQLQTVAVKGEAVRLETDKLLFSGQLQGNTLSGTVSRKGADAPEGQFSVTYDDDPRHQGYEPGSEPDLRGP